MPRFPRCSPLLRDGQPCTRTVAEGSEFCVHHAELAETHGPDVVKRGMPRRGMTGSRSSPPVVIVDEPARDELEVNNGGAVDPATVRPGLAEGVDDIRRARVASMTLLVRFGVKQDVPWGARARRCGHRPGSRARRVRAPSFAVPGSASIQGTKRVSPVCRRRLSGCPAGRCRLADRYGLEVALDLSPERFGAGSRPESVRRQVVAAERVPSGRRQALPMGHGRGL
jgi:hypothetical protein